VDSGRPGSSCLRVLSPVSVSVAGSDSQHHSAPQALLFVFVSFTAVLGALFFFVLPAALRRQLTSIPAARFCAKIFHSFSPFASSQLQLHLRFSSVSPGQLGSRF
jgi:ABC-type phosphate/phosphonate transport system permease subunit